MDFHKIKYCLGINRSGFSEIALRIGVTSSAVRLVCLRNSRSRAIEIEVAKTLGLELCKVFPDWYDVQNQRRSARIVKQMSFDARAKARTEVSRVVSEQVAA